MKKTFLLLISVCAVFIFSACSQNVAHFSVASTGNLPMQNVQKGETVKGKDCITNIFGFNVGNTNNRFSVAVSKALEKAHKNGDPSDALVNVDIRTSYWWFLVGRNCVTAQGQPIGLTKK